MTAGRSQFRAGHSGVEPAETEGTAGLDSGLWETTPSTGMSERMTETLLRFGLAGAEPRPQRIQNLPSAPSPGTLTLVVGPSGSGKTRLLSDLAKRHRSARLVQTIPFPDDVCVLDAVAPAAEIARAMGLLTACGLGEPALWLRRFDELSDGERFRARLARAVSLCRSRPKLLLCDNFAEPLHERLAIAMAHNLRKLVTRSGLAAVVAGTREDIITALRPDRIVRLGGSSPAIEPSPVQGDFAADPFTPQLHVQLGTRDDYAAFSAMHYRHGRAALGVVDKVFVARHESSKEVLAVAVYARPALELSLRNRVTRGHFRGRPERVNAELRVLSRLVVHPDVRGCGVGHWLVGSTLPLAGTRFVECLATMGEVNPVFDKAGMRRIGTIEPRRGRAVVQRLREMGADPLAADFAGQVCRRPVVRDTVGKAVADWYRGATRDGRARAAAMSPQQLSHTFRRICGSRPVYFIWAADEQGWAMLDLSEEGQEA